MNGQDPAASPYAAHPEFGQAWAAISAEVEAIREKHPDAQFDVPGEWPEPDPHITEEET